MSFSNAEPAYASRPQWTAVWALLLAAFVSLLDVTMVNLAVPSIAKDLGATGSQSQWILLAYLIPLAALLLPLGRFGDAVGRRRLFLLGVLTFGMGALAAGTAQGIGVLILARTVQGIGAATMMPQVLALTQVILPPEQRRRAVGYFGMVSALGAVAGPIIGGAVLSIDPFGLGWRVVFLLVIPPCVVSMAIVALFLQRDTQRSSKSLDLWHAALVALAVTGLVFGVAQGRTLEWPIWIIALIPASVLLLARVAYAQSRGLSDRVEPLVPRALLQSTSFLTGAAMILLVFCGIAGVPFLLAIALQAGPQLSPGAVAVALAAHPVLAVAGGSIAGRIAPSNPWTLPTIGSILICCGIGVVVLVFWIAGDDINSLVLVPPLAMIGFGMGLSNVALMSNTLALAPKDSAGAAAGLIQTGQQIGIALSIAIVGGLYFGSVQETTAQATATALFFPTLIFALASSLCLAGAVLHARKAPT